MRPGNERKSEITVPISVPVEFESQQIPQIKINAVTIREKVRASIPSKKKKYDTNDKINELYLEWSSAGENTVNIYDKLIYQFYEIYKSRIVSIARKYRALSPIFDEEDLCQTGHLAILQALKKYKHSPDIEMKFSTYLEWSIKNIFQRAIGSRDKYVEIYTPDDVLYMSMDYHDFQTKKKELLDAGYHYVIKNKLCYISDVVQTGEQEVSGTAMYDLEHDYTDSFKTKQQETMESEENETDEDSPDKEGTVKGTADLDIAASTVKGDRDQKEMFQLIDAIYHNWNVRLNGTRQAQHETTARDIYELYKDHAIEIAGRQYSGVYPLSGTELEQIVMGSISSGMDNYEMDGLPGSKFSLYLEAITRRGLRKATEDKKNREESL